MAKAFTGALVAGVAVAGAAILGIGKAAFSVASDIDSATDQIGASLGLTESEAKKFGDTIKQVYGDNWGDSIEDVGGAIEIVAKQLNLMADDPALATMTENAFRLRDVFGVEVSGSVDAVKTLMDNFGISSQQAFDMLAKGYQQGLDRSGDFLDTVGEYSVQFAEGGASAAEFFSALDTGLQGGMLGTDKAADAFKEFRVRIQDGSTLTADSLAMIGLSADEITGKLADGSITVKQAWDLVQKSLLQTTDISKQFQAGVGLIGTQFEDLGAKVVLGMDLTEDWAEGGIASISEMDTKYTSLGTAAEGMWRKFQLGIAPAGEAILGFINENLPLITQVVETASAAVVEFIMLIPAGMAEVRRLWDEDYAGIQTTLTEWQATATQQHNVFWMEWKKTFGEGTNETRFTWEELWRLLIESATESHADMNEELIFGLRYIRIQREIWSSLFIGDWQGTWDAILEMGDLALNRLTSHMGQFGIDAREIIVDSLNNVWEGMKSVWENVIKWWESSFGWLINKIDGTEWKKFEAVPAPTQNQSWPNTSGMDWLEQNWDKYEFKPSTPASTSNATTINVNLQNGGYEEGFAAGEGMLDVMRSRGAN